MNAIDTTTEQIVSLAKATKSIPSRPSLCTLHRWRMRGIRGVKLETILIGGTRYTSLEALQRFFERTTAAADGEPVPQETSKQRKRSAAAARQVLAAARI